MGISLVTGGTGYLGQHLIDSLLADGIPVRALVYSDWKGEELEAKGVEVVEGDVTDPETLTGIAAGVDTVYHLVGGGNDGRRDPFQINTEATRNMMTVCQGTDVRAFVYISSSSVYGRQPGLVDETTLPVPRFSYPQSKLDAEQLLLEAAQTTGFPAAVARLGGLYGPGAPMLAANLVQNGKLRITGDGQNTISIIHVVDAVRALRAMAEYVRTHPAGQLFCVSDDEPVQLYTFHSHFAQLIAAPPVGTTSIRRVRLIVGLVRFLSRLVGQQPPLTEALIEMSTMNVRMKNHRLREDLGVELAFPTYREGLAQAAAEFLADEEE